MVDVWNISHTLLSCSDVLPPINHFIQSITVICIQKWFPNTSRSSRSSMQNFLQQNIAKRYTQDTKEVLLVSIHSIRLYLFHHQFFSTMRPIHSNPHNSALPAFCCYYLFWKLKYRTLFIQFFSVFCKLCFLDSTKKYNGIYERMHDECWKSIHKHSIRITKSFCMCTVNVIGFSQKIQTIYFEFVGVWRILEESSIEFKMLFKKSKFIQLIHWIQFAAELLLLFMLSIWTAQFTTV